MSRDHARFEILAGAVMLGEASDGERATFAAHATTCEVCRADAASAPVGRQAIAHAHALETWRPSVRDAVFDRIRDAGGSRLRATIGVLGWAVGASIVVNLALASGLSTRLDFAPGGETASGVAATRIELESPRPHAAAVVRVPRARVASPARPAAVPADPGVPDVLAGLDLDGSGPRHVAVEPQPRCSPSATVASDALPPCAPLEVER